MSRIRYIVPLAACAGVLVAGGVGLSGCLNGQAYAQIGDKNQNAATFELQNQTGKSVTAIKVKRADAKKYGTALSQSAPVGQDETVELSYAPSSDKSDIRITTDDGSRYTLHNVNVADIDDATLKVDGQTAYLTYTSIKLGTEQNTLQDEKDLIEAKKKAAEAKKKAEAERKAKAKKAAAAAKKRAEAKKRAQQEKAKAENGADASASTSDQTGSLSSDAAASSDTATADAPADTTPATNTAPAATNTGAATTAAPQQHAASSAPRSSGGNSGGHSGGGSNKESSGGGSSNAAAQKAASANGSGKEQKCTTDF